MTDDKKKSNNDEKSSSSNTLWERKGNLTSEPSTNVKPPVVNLGTGSDAQTSNSSTDEKK